mgnify:CR=1 FL=1|tara:strand:- start:4185 stop:4748 length:564 start_codon:yes stop_codon:yes gene_type:complete
MEKENLVKFDFDFNKVYKKIKIVANKILRGRASNLDKTKYYYLGKEDFIQDTFDLTLKYFKDNHNITEDSFLALFWSNWKIVRLRSFDKRNPRAQEHKSFVQMSTLTGKDDAGKKDIIILNSKSEVDQPDLDLTLLMDKIDSTFPVISTILQGYTFVEAAKEAGVCRGAYYKRYHKEIERLKKVANV